MTTKGKIDGKIRLDINQLLPLASLFGLDGFITCSIGLRHRCAIQSACAHLQQPALGDQVEAWLDQGITVIQRPWCFGCQGGSGNVPLRARSSSQLQVRTILRYLFILLNITKT